MSVICGGKEYKISSLYEQVRGYNMGVRLMRTAIKLGTFNDFITLFKLGFRSSPSISIKFYDEKMENGLTIIENIVTDFTRTDILKLIGKLLYCDHAGQEYTSFITSKIVDNIRYVDHKYYFNGFELDVFDFIQLDAEIVYKRFEHLGNMLLTNAMLIKHITDVRMLESYGCVCEDKYTEDLYDLYIELTNLNNESTPLVGDLIFEDIKTRVFKAKNIKNSVVVIKNYDTLDSNSPNEIYYLKHRNPNLIYGSYLANRESYDFWFIDYERDKLPTQILPHTKWKVHQDIAKELEIMHKQGFIHGDVKRSNIMKRTDSDIYELIDFEFTIKIGSYNIPLSHMSKEMNNYMDVRGVTYKTYNTVEADNICLKWALL